jgi:hypothetical protein
VFEIELRYRGIRALASLPDSEEEPCRGRFVGVAGDIVSFEGTDIDELGGAFRKAVDEYLVHETADTLLMRIVSSDHTEPWTTEREKRRYLVGIYREIDEIERDESVDDLFKRAEGLAFKISRRLKNRPPYKIVQWFEKAAWRGVERARRRKAKRSILGSDVPAGRDPERNEEQHDDPLKKSTRKR